LLVRPDSRGGILGGKVLSIVALTVLQSILFLCASPLAGVSLANIHFFDLLLVVVLGTMALCLFSLAFAWKINSIAGYHSIMALILFPLWVFSGAFFPMDQNWQKAVAFFNPLSYFVTGVRQALGMASGSSGMTESVYIVPLVLSVFVVLGASLCLKTIKKTQLVAQ
jgi:ABC-2 type transport system permease protein